MKFACVEIEKDDWSIWATCEISNIRGIISIIKPHHRFFFKYKMLQDDKSVAFFMLGK
jgi:hypothetical protein